MYATQGGHIKIHLKSDIPVQVDGEPWVQSPGEVVVLKSALKVTPAPYAPYPIPCSVHTPSPRLQLFVHMHANS